jgi:hypothetical protein
MGPFSMVYAFRGMGRGLHLKERLKAAAPTTFRTKGRRLCQYYSTEWLVGAAACPFD